MPRQSLYDRAESQQQLDGVEMMSHWGWRSQGLVKKRGHFRSGLGRSEREGGVWRRGGRPGEASISSSTLRIKSNQHDTCFLLKGLTTKLQTYNIPSLLAGSPLISVDARPTESLPASHSIPIYRYVRCCSVLACSY